MDRTLRQLSWLALLLVASTGCGDKGADTDTGLDTDVEPPQGCPDDGTTATWGNFAQGYITTWCTPCHSSALPEGQRYDAPLGVDFDTFEDVQAQAGLIKAYATGPTPAMPPAGGPSDEERELLRQWLDCGLPGGTTEQPSACEGEPNLLAGDLVVTSEASAADLCATHTGVSGDLRVEGPVDLALDCVCEVGGGLTVGADVVALSLPALSAVGGDLAVEEGSTLTELRVPALEAVRGDLRVVSTPALEELQLDALEAVGGSLVVDGTGSLGRFWAPRLESVGGDWQVTGNLAMTQVTTDRLREVGGSLLLEDNSALAILVGDAYQLETVAGDLLVRNNPALSGLDETFRELQSVGGDLELVGNHGLDRVFAFEELGEVEGHLWIRDNGSITSVDGFDFLTRVGGSLEVSGNASLVVIEAFRVLDEVGESGDPLLGEHELRIADNPKLLDISGAVDVRFLGGLRITGNPKLPEIKGFHDLVAVADTIELADNGAVLEIDAFGGMTALGGDLVIRDNGSLVLLEGLYSLGSLPGDLTIERNQALQRVKLGSNAVPFITVAGDLRLVDNDALVSLYELDDLTSVGGSLVLSEHALLTDVSALHSLGLIGGDLVVTDNASLVTADAEALRDAVQTIGGTVDISGNAP